MHSFSVSTTSGEGHQPTVAVAASGVTAGSYGSGSAIPSITVDATGRITAASTSSVDTYSGFDFGVSGSDATVAETENVYIAGGTGIDASFSSDGTTHTVTLSQDLNELTTSTSNGDGDYFVVVDTSGDEKKLQVYSFKSQVCRMQWKDSKSFEI